MSLLRKRINLRSNAAFEKLILDCKKKISKEPGTITDKKIFFISLEFFKKN